MNFTDFYSKLLQIFMNIFYIKFSQKEWRNITVKIGQFYQIRTLRYFRISSFSSGDFKNLRVPNFMQIYLFLLYRSAIVDPLFWISAHIAPKYLDNIVEIFHGNIVRLLKYFETYHLYCWNIVTILLCPHTIWRTQYLENTSKCINNIFLK